MKKNQRALLFIALFMVCWLLPAGKAEAAAAKKLFSIVVNDGFVSQTVPVYQYTESDGSMYVAPKENLRTLPVYAGAKTASITIKGKSSLYKKTFKSLSYKKKVPLSGTTTLTYKLKKKDGTIQKATLKLTRPSMPKISALSVSPGQSTGFTPGNYNRLAIKLSVRSGVEVQAGYKIKNSSGKVVFQKQLLKKKSVNYTSYWSGKPSADNAAKLSASAYVPAGTYKVTAYIQYVVGGKTKTVSKTVKIKVNSAETAAKDDASGSDDDFQSANWNWKVILTGDDAADYLAEQICQQVVKNGMTEAARAKALYQWMGNNMTHAYSAPKTNGKAYMDITSKNAKAAITEYGKQMDKQIRQGKAVDKKTDNYFAKGSTKRDIWIEQGLVYRNGDCLIMALVYSTLCRHAGIEADIMENTLASGGNGHHFWNVMKVGGVYYMTDADMVTYSKGISSYDYFLRGTNYMNKWARYKKARTNGGYSVVSSVSKTDCPER